MRAVSKRRPHSPRRALQNLGFTLDEVIDSLHARDGGNATCRSQRWRLETVLARIDAKISELEALRGHVTEVLHDCDQGECRFAAERP